MALFSRSSSSTTPSSTSTATVVHARVADGEHLWLAVRGADDARLVLQHVHRRAPEIEVPVEAEGDLLVAVFPLAAALADDLAADDDPQVELRLCHGRDATPVVADLGPRPPGPTIAAPPTRDGRWQLSAEVVDDELVVRRRAVAPARQVLGIRRTDDGVEVRLDDRTLILGAMPDLADVPAGEPVPVVVDGLPVRRSRNVLARPQLAVALPPMVEPDVELRWLRDGRLASVRLEPTR